jgi:hypothetical protein
MLHNINEVFIFLAFLLISPVALVFPFGMGQRVFVDTRINIYRFVERDTHDVIGATTLGLVGAFWWCFAATVFLDVSNRSSWQMALRAWMLSAAVGVALVVVTWLGHLPPVTFSPVVGLALLLAIILGLCLLMAEFAVSILLGGLLAIRSALDGIHTGTRMLASFVYIAFEMPLFIGRLVLIVFTWRNGVTDLLLVLWPGYLILYALVCEMAVRLLWRGIVRRTSLTLPLLVSIIHTTDPFDAEAA